MRIGHGWDLHRLSEGLPLWIGGVAVESPVGSLGHSDGDVLLHALIDALLGATGQGDIGEHFPPSAPQWRGARSLDLLARIWEPLRSAGWRIENIDATVILERPKLSPYKAVIRQQVAEALGLSPDQVSVKAKTAEGLGAEGRGEAISATAVVLLTGLAAS